MTAPETPAPKSTAIPFVTDAVRLVRVLVMPTETFEENREAPAFWIPWILVCVLLLAVAMLSFPHTIAAMRLGAEAQGRPFPESMANIVRFSSFVAIPVMTLLMTLLSAGLMWVVLLAAGGSVRFKGLMSVSINLALIGVLQGLLMYVVLTLRGPEGLRTVADYQVSFGLDLLLPADSAVPGFVAGMLRGVTPFAIWGLILTAIGVRVTERTSNGGAWTAASAAFLLGMVGTAIGAMFQQAPR